MSRRIADELAGIDLKDQRLNRRAQQLLETLAANPEASINAACDTWSETQAAYRFCDNPHVTPEVTHYLTADSECEKVYQLLKAKEHPRFQFVHLSTSWHQAFGQLDITA